MPMEVVMDFPLLALDEPPSLAVEVVSNIFTEVESLNDLLSIEVLFVRSYVDYHWAFTTVTLNHSEELRAESFLSVLFKPVSLFC